MWLKERRHRLNPVTSNPQPYLDVNLAPGGGREGFQRTLHNAKLHVGVQWRLKFICTHTFAHAHAYARIVRAKSSLSERSVEAALLALASMHQ